MAPPKVHFALQTQENTKPTVHVDAFLYDEETVDHLCEEGKMSRNFCLSCGSHRTAPMGNFSHFLAGRDLFVCFSSPCKFLNVVLVMSYRIHLTFLLNLGAPVPVSSCSPRPGRKGGSGCGFQARSSALWGKVLFEQMVLSVTIFY